MEFYNLGKVVFSSHISKHQKKDAIARSLTKISLSFTSGIAVGILGQILIPIPIFGAIVGGFVGGLVGGAIGD
jgi:phage tail tape-measure protein